MKIIPVIHHLTNQLTLDNAQICADEKAYGVFLISMTGDNEYLPMLAKAIKGKHPELKVGINLLGKTALDSLETSLIFNLDMTWSDNPIVTSAKVADDARAISDLITNKEHLFFNSVAFKYQKIENSPGEAARLSKELGFIPTTSGKATGQAADLAKILKMKQAIGDHPLAVASGLDPDNILSYLNHIDYGLVATGISKTFHELCQEKLKLILNMTTANLIKK